VIALSAAARLQIYAAAIIAFFSLIAFRGAGDGRSPYRSIPPSLWCTVVGRLKPPLRVFYLQESPHTDNAAFNAFPIRYLERVRARDGCMQNPAYADIALTAERFAGMRLAKGWLVSVLRINGRQRIKRSFKH
jgi:hypothetical protein